MSIKALFIKTSIKICKLISLSIILLITLAYKANSQGYSEFIAITNQSVGDGNIITDFSSTMVSINNNGTCAFTANLNSDQSIPTVPRSGIYTANSNGVIEIATTNQRTPDELNLFTGFGIRSITLNNNDSLAFTAGLASSPSLLTFPDSAGVFVFDSSGAIEQIWERGDSPPDNNGTFFSVDPPLLNDEGTVVLRSGIINSTLPPGVDGNVNDFGIFINEPNSGQLIQILRRGQVLPNTNDVATFISDAYLNQLGDVAVRPMISDFPSDTNDLFQETTSVLLYRDSELIELVRGNGPIPERENEFFEAIGLASFNNNRNIYISAQLNDSFFEPDEFGHYLISETNQLPLFNTNQTLPGTSGNFNESVSFPVANDSDNYAFRAAITNLPGIPFRQNGIFLNKNGELKSVFLPGMSLPNNSGIITSGGFQSFAFNESSVVAVLNLISGATTDGSLIEALHLSDGEDIVEAFRRGDQINGHEVALPVFTIDNLRRNADGFNDHGQVAYKADISSTAQEINEVIIVFTPDLLYRRNTDGDWDNNDNWTLSLLPGVPHDVFISPESSNVNVTGSSSDTTVRNLNIGDQDGIASLELISPLTVIQTLNVANNGTLKLNNSQVTLNNPLSILNGTVTGFGTISGDVNNQGGKLIAQSGGTPLVINGDVIMTNAELLFEINEADPKHAGVLSVNGSLEISGGTVTLNFKPDFNPPANFELNFLNDVYELLLSEDVQIATAGLDPNINFDIQPSENGIGYIFRITPASTNVPYPLWLNLVVAVTLLLVGINFQRYI